MKSQRVLWLALAATIVIGLIWQLIPLKDASTRINTLPLNGLSYSGEDLPLSDQEKKIFKDVNVIKREYQVGNEKYFVTVLDGTNNRHAVHDPSYCFAGGGFKMVEAKEIQSSNGPINEVTLQRDGEKLQALYWFSNGNQTYTSPLEYWKETTLRRLSLGAFGNEPVLIMVMPMEKSSINARELQQKFSPLFSL